VEKPSGDTEEMERLQLQQRAVEKVSQLLIRSAQTH
jgi:hypothetical protein